MPKARVATNEGLPTNWRIKHGAYYYRVPSGARKLWEHKQDYRLGATLGEAMEVFRSRYNAIDLDAGINVPPIESVTAARIPIDASFIYFLFDGDTCVYVGQTRGLTQRISQHKAMGKQFTHYSHLQCEKERATLMEAVYISRHAPKYNVKQLGFSEETSL
jgi:predicted GIY-YIG superfamily endonuclease